MSWFVVTNTVNLARIISFGCLGPRTLFGDKYRSDACSLADGALPLFGRPPAAGLLRRMGQDKLTFVLVELGDDDLFPVHEDVVLTGSLVPTSAVTSVHFETAEASKDYLSTPFENVDPASLEVQVSPDLFSGEDGPDVPTGRSPSQGSTYEDGTSSLFEKSGLSPSPSLVDAETIRIIDRRLGAVAEICRPVTPSQASVALACEVLKAGLSCPVGGETDPVEHAGAVPAEDVAIHRAVSVLMLNADPRAKGAASFLDALSESIRDAPNGQLSEMRKVLRGRRDLTDVLATGGTVLNGLLLALIADSPQGVRDRTREETGGDDRSELLALWYAGLRRGLARRPTNERVLGLEPQLQLAAARFGAAGNPPALEPPPGSIGTASIVSDEAFEYHFTGDVRFAAGKRALPSAADRLRDALRAPDVLVAVADRIGVPVAITIQGSVGVSIEAIDGGLRIHVAGPHRFERTADREAVESALAELDAGSAMELVEAFAPLPDVAP